MGENEGRKAQGRCEICEQRRIANLHNHPLKRHGFVSVPLVFRVVFIDQINAIRNPDDNHQRRDQAHDQVHREIK